MDDVWGIPLGLYLNRPVYHPDPRASTQEVHSASQEVLSAIRKLSSADDITVPTLEKVLQIIYYPTLLKHMRSPGIIPACMTLIRNCSHKREASDVLF
jgi:hypothetical protein